MSPLRGIREIWLRLKTSSYLFMKTENTGQVSVGVVKAPGVLHKKTDTQHLVDLHRLKEKREIDVFSREDY